jgi:hypothetical protein
MPGGYLGASPLWNLVLMGHQAQSEGEEGVVALVTMEFLFCMLYLRLTRLFYLLNRRWILR